MTVKYVKEKKITFRLQITKKPDILQADPWVKLMSVALVYTHVTWCFTLAWKEN